MKVVEIFPSLQGEGVLMGLPTVFIRFSGCNLRCKWCDTTYAYEDGEEMSIEAILEEINKIGIQRVCLTGGEPLLQEEIFALIRSLNGHELSIETNGSLDISQLLEFDILISQDIKCPSSGMSHSNLLDNIEKLRQTDQLKFVIADEADFQYAKDILEKHPPACPVIFTPVGGIDDLDELVELVLEDNLQNVRVLPQLHKLIWPEEERGR